MNLIIKGSLCVFAYYLLLIPARPFSAYNQGFYPSKVFIFKLKTDKHFFDIFLAKLESMQPILVRTNEKRPRIARA